MLPEAPHEPPRWEPEPLHIPAPDPVRPRDRREDSEPESEAPGSRVIVIDLV